MASLIKGWLMRSTIITAEWGLERDIYEVFSLSWSVPCILHETAKNKAQAQAWLWFVREKIVLLNIKSEQILPACLATHSFYNPNKNSPLLPLMLLICHILEDLIYFYWLMEHTNVSLQVCKEKLLFGHICYFGSNFPSSLFPSNICMIL